MKKYQEGDLIRCTVKDVVKTTVFVEAENGMKGSIVFSEVAPGRIRNIRDYVVPNKVIVCKILNISHDHLFLSLRRVKDKEKKELLDQYKREKSIESIIKKIVGKDAEEIIKEIRNELSLDELFTKAREDLKLLEKYFKKEFIDKLLVITLDKKDKEKEIKKEFSISSKEPDGIKRIKKILSPYNNITYLGSSSFMIKIKSADLKHAGSELNKILETIEKQAKKEKCLFAIKK